MSLAQEIASTLENECSKQRLIKKQEHRLSDALIIMLIKCYKISRGWTQLRQIKLVPCHVTAIIFNDLLSRVWQNLGERAIESEHRNIRLNMKTEEANQRCS